MKATIAFSSTSWRHTNTTRGVSIAITLLVDECPFGLEQRERDEPDDRCRGHEQGIADLPAAQDDEAPERDECREPVTDGDPAEEHAGAEDRADGGGIGAPDEALHVRVRAVADEDWRDDQDEQKRRQEDADRRDHRTPKALKEGEIGRASCRERV